MPKCSANWLFMSPVMEKMISYNNLFDGSITLFDLHKMNEAMSYKNDLDKKIYDYYQEGK